ncbi:MAG: hypothetical protein EOM20_16395 [Spartobacteria bacterium]|nr:hypothetical protein [Spartobacteria bacterium]
MNAFIQRLAVPFIMISHVCMADVVIDMTTIGNPGNPAKIFLEGDPHEYQLGGVDYTYQIGTYEVTVSQYTEFLNAAAKSDPYGMYNPSMGGGFAVGGSLILRSGESGSYTYTAEAGKENQPVRGVNGSRRPTTIRILRPIISIPTAVMKHRKNPPMEPPPGR